MRQIQSLQFSSSQTLLMSRFRSCWWVRIRTRSDRAFYWDFCRSSSGAYHVAIFDSYILKIAWCLQPIVNISTRDMFTGDWCLGMWVNFQWNWVAFLCCTYLVRATVNFSWFDTEASFTSTTLVQIRDAVQFQPVVLILYQPLHSSGINVFKSRRMIRETNGLDLVDLRFLFKLDLDRLSWDLGVIWI